MRGGLLFTAHNPICCNICLITAGWSIKLINLGNKVRQGMEKDILKKPYVALRGIYIFEGAAVYLNLSGRQWMD
jgi:hypothetical protein